VLSGPPPSTPEPIGPAARKPRSGCLIALYAAFGVGALLLLVGAIATWIFLRSEQGQKVLEVAKESVAFAEEAMQAPGTEELRAAGCAQAMVMSSARMLELMGELVPELREGGADAGSLADATVVLCQLGMLEGKGPDCAEVARLYAASVPDAPERVAVIVQGQGRSKAECQGFHARDGSFLGPLGRE
jgi:hypothetical protein